MNCQHCNHDLGPRIEMSMSLTNNFEWNLNIQGDLPSQLYYELKKDNTLYFQGGMFTQGMGGAIKPYDLLKHALEILDKIRGATGAFNNQTKVVVTFVLDRNMTIKEEYPIDYRHGGGDFGSPVESELSYWKFLKDYLDEHAEPPPRFIPSKLESEKPTKQKKKKE